MTNKHERELDWEILYPAKDWKEALKRIMDSGWHITVQDKYSQDGETVWLAAICDNKDRSKSFCRCMATAPDSEGGLCEAVKRAYDVWRERQIAGEEED